MTPDAFDEFTRALATGRPRRQVLKLLVASMVSGLPLLARQPPTSSGSAVDAVHQTPFHQLHIPLLFSGYSGAPPPQVEHSISQAPTEEATLLGAEADQDAEIVLLRDYLTDQAYVVGNTEILQYREQSAGPVVQSLVATTYTADAGGTEQTTAILAYMRRSEELHVAIAVILDAANVPLQGLYVQGTLVRRLYPPDRPPQALSSTEQMLSDAELAAFLPAGLTGNQAMCSACQDICVGVIDQHFQSYWPFFGCFPVDFSMQPYGPVVLKCAFGTIKATNTSSGGLQPEGCNPSGGACTEACDECGGYFECSSGCCPFYGGSCCSRGGCCPAGTHCCIVNGVEGCCLGG